MVGMTPSLEELEAFWSDEQRAASVPYDVQERMYWATSLSNLDRLHELLDERWEEIEALGAERLKQGFRIYGSTMYRWQQPERLQNVLEELADSLVYLSSGEV